ncbi:MAG: NUDIX hydrolase [Anaerolineales bacterium]
MTFTTISSKTIFQGKVFELHQDEVRMPDGNHARLDIIQHPPSVTLLPVDEENQIWFIRQYRQAAGEEILELPAGVIEKGEAPLACAQREIREETGMSAAVFELIGEFYLAPGYSSEYMYVYLASELKEDPLPGDEDEFISVVRISVEDAYRMAEAGEIRDVKTIAALLLAAPHIKTKR